MHHYHSDGETLGAIIAGSVVLLFLYAVVKAFNWIFSPSKAEEPQPDIVGEALRVVSTPMQLPGGRFGFYETTLKECPAPITQGELIVHDRTNPQHVANCLECRDGRKFRGSGVSWRSN